MRQLNAFIKKEYTELIRSNRLLIMGIVFVVFGIMNPAIAKITPWLMEAMADSMAETGLIVSQVSVDAMTSWTQFYKNVPIMMIIIFIMFSGIFTVEYQKHTLINMITKGLVRYRIVLANTIIMWATWTVGYWMCFGITYAYNAYYWDNGIVKNLLPAILCVYVLGIWIISLVTLASVIFNGNTAVVLTTGAIVIVGYVASMFASVSRYIPVALLNSQELLVGAGNVSDYACTMFVTIVWSLVNILAAIRIFNKKVI